VFIRSYFLNRPGSFARLYSRQETLGDGWKRSVSNENSSAQITGYLALRIENRNESCIFKKPNWIEFSKQGLSQLYRDPTGCGQITLSVDLSNIG
jgi:hypothetical protein